MSRSYNTKIYEMISCSHSSLSIIMAKEYDTILLKQFDLIAFFNKNALTSSSSVINCSICLTFLTDLLNNIYMEAFELLYRTYPVS